MRNRAKCKLCQSVIESFHATDYVSCKCGEISIDGGNMHLKASAKDWANFMRVDDEDNEIFVKVKDKHVEKSPEIQHMDSDIHTKPTREEIMRVLAEMIISYEGLPQAALVSPITHYDLLSVLLLVQEILRCDAKESS